MRTLRYGAAAGALLIAAVGAGEAAATGFQKQMTAGRYIFEMEGVITFVGGGAAGLPTYSVGIYDDDGVGGISNINVAYNVAGCVTIQFAGSGSYQIDADGRGTATSDVTAETITPSGVAGCPDLSSLPADVTWEYEFVATANRDAGNLIGISAKDASGNPLLAWGGSGTVKKQ